MSPTTNPPDDLDIARAAARAGAAVVRRGFGTTRDARYKGDVNPVTAVDVAAEEAVLTVIRRHRPDDEILAEETGIRAGAGGRLWIVDPLDGTVNFLHGLPHVSVSVALWTDGVARVGVVLDALRGEEFAAAKGNGAFRDGNPLLVSEEARLDRALVATGFPYDRQEHAREYAEVVAAVLERAQGVRRLGSAALDLAWVACGRYDAYWEFGLGPWDAAAGILLVEEAGGQVTDTLGAPARLRQPGIVAANARLHEELRSLVAARLPAHLR